MITKDKPSFIKNELVVDFACGIIDVLKQEKYKISKSQINHMKNILDKSVILDIKHIIDNKVPLLDIYKNYYGSIEVLNIPQVIDAPPVCSNNRIIEMYPVMILDVCELKEISWSVVHEICHLLSIGKYTYLDDYIHHNFGINEYKYAKANMMLIENNENNCINELITDYAVWCLLEAIYGYKVEPIYKGLKEFSEYLECRFTEEIDSNSFIGWYFSGHVSKIKKVLLDNDFKSYDDILEHIIN